MYMVAWGGLGAWNLNGHGVSLFNMKIKQTLNCQKPKIKNLNCFEKNIRAFNKINI